MDELEPIPTDAVWFTRSEFRELLKDWLADYDGVRYAVGAMAAAHGSWT